MNIVYIGSDQHRFDCVGVNGHSMIRTPNLDRLAANGTNFTNAYTPCPVCTPARASLLTGQWSFQHGALTIPQWTEASRGYDRDLPTFPELLRDAGFFQGYVGKWHVDELTGHPRPEELGIDEYVPESCYSSWRTERGLPPPGGSLSWAEAAQDPAIFDRYIRGTVDTAITADESRLHWGAEHAIRMIRSAAESDRAFFVRWDPSEPHLINNVPEPYGSMYDPSEIEPWGSFAEAFERKPYIQRQQLESWGVGRWTWDDWAPVVARYLGEITLLDHEIGRVVEAVHEAGRSEDTVIVYTTDHGDMCGSHRMIDKQFVMYDDLVRVPLIVSMPGAANRGRECDHFVSHAIDLASTICDLTEVEQPPSFRGESLVPALTRGGAGHRTDILSAFHGAQFGLFSQRMVRDSEWKYVWNPTERDELYHLEIDPWELVNLAGDAGSRAELHRLRRRLAAWMEETGDPLLNAWTRFQLLHDRKLDG